MGWGVFFSVADFAYLLANALLSHFSFELDFLNLLECLIILFFPCLELLHLVIDLFVEHLALSLFDLLRERYWLVLGLAFYVALLDRLVNRFLFPFYLVIRKGKFPPQIFIILCFLLYFVILRIKLCIVEGEALSFSFLQDFITLFSWFLLQNLVMLHVFLELVRG